jgi:hypothetical protein
MRRCSSRYFFFQVVFSAKGELKFLRIGVLLSVRRYVTVPEFHIMSLCLLNIANVVIEKQK